MLELHVLIFKKFKAHSMCHDGEGGVDESGRVANNHVLCYSFLRGTVLRYQAAKWKVQSSMPTWGTLRMMSARRLHDFHQQVV